ncbi:MAG: cation diffusion facilitator family transporter, partial [Actinomycetota bacterium]|nr:cation diffusion facilitator family transporter [Actinomycetota bacterium]
VGVILAAVIMILSGWPYADPLFAALIGVFILPRAWMLGSQALRILTQAAPAGLDIENLTGELEAIPGVIDVHDLHVWTLTSDMDVATVHLMINTGTDPHPVLDQARDLLQARHDITHATLQVEPENHHGCSELAW